METSVGISSTAKDRELELEAPGDPVTRADREASEMICTALAAFLPGDADLSGAGGAWRRTS